MTARGTSGLRALPAVAALALSAAATAQDTAVLAMDSPRAGAIPHDPDGVRFAYRYGTCLASVDSDAGGVLALLPDSKRADNILVDMARYQSGCADWQDRTRFAPKIYRGMIAEYYYTQQFVEHGRKSRQPHVAIYREPDREQLTKMDKEDVIAVMMVGVGGCVDKLDHAAAAALLQSEVTNKEEDVAFAAVMPLLSDCLQPGMKIAYTRLQLGGFIAEGMYRAAVAQQSTVS